MLQTNSGYTPCRFKSPKYYKGSKNGENYIQYRYFHNKYPQEG